MPENLTEMLVLMTDEPLVACVPPRRGAFQTVRRDGAAGACPGERPLELHDVVAGSDVVEQQLLAQIAMSAADAAGNPPRGGRVQRSEQARHGQFRPPGAGFAVL